jgi:hypothetical protein
VDFNLHIPSNLLLFLLMSLLASAEISQPTQETKHRVRVGVTRRREAAAEPTPA